MREGERIIASDSISEGYVYPSTDLNYFGKLPIIDSLNCLLDSSLPVTQLRDLAYNILLIVLNLLSFMGLIQFLICMGLITIKRCLIQLAFNSIYCYVQPNIANRKLLGKGWCVFYQSS